LAGPTAEDKIGPQERPQGVERQGESGDTLGDPQQFVVDLVETGIDGLR
jgi:hypothetical protein